jgi:hypothetical protein
MSNVTPNRGSYYSTGSGYKYSPLQARIIDAQISDNLATQAGKKLVSNIYSKPMLYSSIGLGGIGSYVLGPGAKASLYGDSGLLFGAANKINPVALSSAKAIAGSSVSKYGLGKALAAAYAPLKAAVTLPGYSIGSGLAALGSHMGTGALAKTLLGAGTAISGGALAPAIGTAVSLYALKKGGELASRLIRSRGAANRISMLQKGLAPMERSILSKGYDANTIRDLGLRLVR